MMEFYERASGARMHAAYVRPGGVHQVRFHTKSQSPITQIMFCRDLYVAIQFMESILNEADLDH